MMENGRLLKYSKEAIHRQDQFFQQKKTANVTAAASLYWLYIKSLYIIVIFTLDIIISS